MHSVRPRRKHGLILGAVFAFILGVMAGCETDPLLDLGEAPQADAANPDEVAFVESSIIEKQYDNDAFQNAQPATLAAVGEIVIEGGLDSSIDVDLFDLGPVIAGDPIVIDVAGYGAFDPVAALFDADGSLIRANDDRAFYFGQDDPFISQVIAIPSESLYLGIAQSRTAGPTLQEAWPAPRSYTVRVMRGQPEQAPTPQAQLVWLDFEGGGTVQIGLTLTEQMRPFSAESMSGRFTGQTDEIIASVVELMRRDFGGYQVTLRDSRHYPRPSEPHTTVYFGNFNDRFLGLADSVDVGNAFIEQDAIIYTENLAMFEYLLRDADDAAQAVANIASHELGHLLGLKHSGEADDLMATGFSATPIIRVDRAFYRPRLNAGVFPVGWQDGPAILAQSVGIQPGFKAQANQRRATRPTLPESAIRSDVDAGSLPIWTCGTCVK